MISKSTLIIIPFCFLATILKSNVCSPVITPFQEWLNEYNQTDYIIIEGHFLKSKESYFSSNLKVTQSSDSSIKIGQEYEVYEYEPFGSMCEMSEIKSSIKPELVGKNRTRLLIVYKERSTNGRLVAPIFWEIGATVSNNKIVAKEYDSASKQYISYQCSSKLDEIWKQILSGNTLRLKWEQLTNPN